MKLHGLTNPKLTADVGLVLEYYYNFLIIISIPSTACYMDVNYADDKVLLRKRGIKIVSVMLALSAFSSKAVKRNNKVVFKNERSLE
jgi:hypothetical protein